MVFEKIILNEERNVTFSAFVQPVGGEFANIKERPAVLILPGGGYQVCSDREAEIVAFAYLAVGYQAFVLRYSVKDNAKWPNPLNDYEQAMDLIKQNAEKWHVSKDRIAVVGFSAGGHLAACAATIARNRPAAVILGYPAIKKDVVDMCRTDLPYPAEYVGDTTCPCFIFAARDDNTVHISNALVFAQALSDHDVSFEMHLYSFGGHGFSTAVPALGLGAHTARLGDWVKDSIGWLEEAWGKFTQNGFSKPLFSRAVNGNHENVFSVDCTVGYLKGHYDLIKDAAGKYIDQIDQVLLGNFNQYTRTYLGSLFKLGDLMMMLRISGEEISALDCKLRKIKNVRS